MGPLEQELQGYITPKERDDLKRLMLKRNVEPRFREANIASLLMDAVRAALKCND